MNKLFVFDIDGTLSDLNEPIDIELVNTLTTLSKTYKIVLASGKPCSYIAGLVRQTEIRNCIIIGENGATIMYSSTFPPQKYYEASCNINTKKYLKFIKESFNKKFGQSIWFQPNSVILTIFPLDINSTSKIHTFAEKFRNNLINIYYNKDSVDFIPKGIDKGMALLTIINDLKIHLENLYVFGDSTNDIPMLKLTKNCFLINSDLPEIKPLKVFKNYKELNIFLKDKIKELKYDRTFQKIN